MTGIPESQLSVWAKQGAVVIAASTYGSVKNALLSSDTSPVRYKDIDIYLQGSYRNDTNIRGDSDIDVVVQLNSTFSRDLSKLSRYETELYLKTFPNATYLWEDFRSDVLQALHSYYGRDKVSEGNKCLKISEGSGRLAADVVVCLEHRDYRCFYGLSDQSYVEAIKFFARSDGRGIINYPKVHYENGVDKNSAQRTGGSYKLTVRMFKNARTYLSDRGIIADDLAPSYFLECLIYNAPDWTFAGTHRDTFYNVLGWLSTVEFGGLVCQNEQILLFGPTPEQWNMGDSQELTAALIGLWNNW